ncbi:MAG: NUDIX hydrolase [Ectothiorhodospiraceae bacterium]|nr:NUDIX hydrolase [Chromatiales bacterium]MCP5154811.1 NUDIX hydrolase [Ectothiorhodospiraceae bacterium]
MGSGEPVLPGDSAPEVIVWCCRCRGTMGTREVQGRPRRVCEACGFIHFVEAKVGVGVCVIDDDRLLLVRRRFNPEKGRWSLPAGFLDSGDDPRACAVREAREETGLEVRVTGLVDVFHNPPQRGGATLFVLFEAEIVGGRLEAADDATDADFFPLDALPDLAFPSTRHAVDMLRARSPRARR